MGFEQEAPDIGMTPHIFFLNLDRASDRLAFMQSQAAAAGVEIERVQGTLGTAVDTSVRSQFLNEDGSIASHLSAGEVGCYASHLKAYREVVDRDLPLALVLEDDVELPAGLAGILRETVAHLPAQWDVVKLCNSAERAVYTLSVLSNGSHLVRFYRQPPLAGAYLISNTGARKMLAARPRVRPVDIEFRQPWHIGLDMYGVCPRLIQQRHDIESEIGKLGRRGRSGPRDRAPARTFAYAVGKIGLMQTLVCRVVEWTALLGLRTIGNVWVGEPTRPRRLAGRRA